MDNQLINYAYDGKKLYRVVMKRLTTLHRSLNDLAHTADVAFTTIWRWNQGSKPEIDTVLKVQRVIEKWEALAIH